jgi:uncharacterized GH25 family protein
LHTHLLKIVACFCWALILATQPARAHDFWIEPDNFSPDPGAAVAVSLREGMEFKGNSLPYVNDWFSDFSKVDAGGRTDVISIMGDDPAAQLNMKTGALLLGYRSNRNYTELDAAKFNNYLKDEGIEFIRAERIANNQDDQPAREYFVRCAKALLQSGRADDDVYGTELGYILELVALNDPYSLSVGDELGFRLMYRGEPAGNLLVQAFTRADPKIKQRVRTDEEGFAKIQLTEAGIWMVKAVNIQPIIGDPKADWQSYWASYVFALEPQLQ